MAHSRTHFETELRLSCARTRVKPQESELNQSATPGRHRLGVSRPDRDSERDAAAPLLAPQSHLGRSDPQGLSEGGHDGFLLRSRLAHLYLKQNQRQKAAQEDRQAVKTFPVDLREAGRRPGAIYNWQPRRGDPIGDPNGP